MKIVIQADTLASWSGGVDLLKLLVKALTVREEHSFHLLIKGTVKAPSFIEKNFRSLVRSWYRHFKPAAPVGYEDLPACVELVTYAYRKEEALEQLQPDIIFPCMDQPGTIPSVAYLYDCQHRHYPEFFTLEGIAARDRTFQKLLGGSKSAIVTSQDAKRDLLTFYPETQCEIVALPFSPMLGDSWLEEQPQRLDRYSLPAKYFVISNQFWIHKNHLTAFEAVSELRDAGEDIYLVCTGKMTDSRAPDHADNLLRWIADKQLESRIILLGYIDKRDQIEILKNSVAVIQPTLFEGLPGGLSVADAMSLGCRVIVSDLPINRELPTDRGVRYFPARDAKALANEMKEVWVENHRRPADAVLLKQQAESLKLLSDALYAAIDRAVH